MRGYWERSENGKGFIGQFFCGHYWSPSLKAHNYMNGKCRCKRHFYECEKCGKRKYVD